MKIEIFNLDTWPNYLKWLLFFPISILAFLLFFFISYISELRYPGGAFFFLLTIGLIGRPLTVYVGITIVPDYKKVVGYIYIFIYCIDLFSNILDAINQNVIVDSKFLGTTIGIFVGTVITYFVVQNISSNKTDTNNS